MPTDYEKIRKENIRKYGEEAQKLISLLSGLYADRAHFVFEILQNAEDAGASRVLFRLFGDRLEVTHDGRFFDERDVRGVCGIAEGTKKESLTQIGEFGIGFKSVYAYTTTPEIHSGGESFRIENSLQPSATPPRKTENGKTLFIFPFDSEDVDPETACREIGDHLCRLSVRTLLFLRKISEIEYVLPDSEGGIYMREEKARGHAKQVNVIGQDDDGKDEEESWLIFERPVAVPGKAVDVRVEAAFRLQTEDKPRGKGERINKVGDSPLVVYFPTEKPTGLGFLIQGPYRTTPARDNVPKDDEWNARLVTETAGLLTEAMAQIKQMGLLTVSFLETLPINRKDFPEGGMFYPIAEAVREALLGEELLPADDDSFVSGRNAKLARGGDLRNLLGLEQLRLLFQSTETLKWLCGEITSDRTPELRSYLMLELGVEEVDPEDFSRKISPQFLESQRDEWFTDFYAYLSGQEALWRPPRWHGDPGGVLWSKPILRLHDGSHEVPFTENGGVPSVFLPSPEETDFPIIKRSIANDEKSRAFLKRLGLSEPDVFDDIVKRVLPKYAEAGGMLIPAHEHSADIDKIFRAMASDSESGKKKIRLAARRIPFLKAVDSSGDTEFKKPGEIYLGTADLRHYFSNSPATRFLSEDYPSKEQDTEVWTSLGVAELPRKLPTSEGLPREKRERFTRYESVENYDLDGLERFLEDIRSISDFAEQKGNASILWRFLRKHLTQDARFFKARYNWFYRTSQTKYFPSMALSRLKNMKWIPTKSGTMEKPAEITTARLFDEFADARELTQALGIVESADGAELSEEEMKRKYLESLGFSPKEIEALQNKKKNHPGEFKRWLEEPETAGKEKPEFPRRTVANPQRRRKRLEEELSNVPEKKYDKRKRSIRTTDSTIDPVTWLRNQYTNDSGQMICQICKEEMPFRKRNGEYYFEKKEVLSIKYLPKEHEVQYLALCPLCAAMYEEFVKKDADAMTDLKKKLVSANDCDVTITLGDKEASIRFVETHYHDLKVIITKQGIR